MTTLALCHITELQDPGSKSFVVDRNGSGISILVVRRGNAVFGYVNACPHIGAPLDWQARNFLDVERRHILCANHGALFEIETGYCIAGPCAGKSLENFPLTLLDGQVLPG